jgi:YMGG-like Gly-zipper
MKKGVFILVFMLVLAFCAGSALAQELIVFPAKGQSQEQMEKDKYDCYTWAKQQTGFDPMKAQPAQAPPPPPQSQGPSGERVKGAARGAAVGAVVGEIADDDAGKGATAGAAAGVMAGGMKTRQQRRQQTQQQQQASQQQQATTNEARNAYNRALGACLEGKGYTVK